MTGVSLTVLPGYQAWAAEQREKLLQLAEAGQFTGRTIWARELADGAVYVSDRATPRGAGETAAYIIHRDGEADRVAVPLPRARSSAGVGEQLRKGGGDG